MYCKLIQNVYIRIFHNLLVYISKFHHNMLCIQIFLNKSFGIDENAIKIHLLIRTVKINRCISVNIFLDLFLN